jgi:hypothetical protein
MNGSVTSVNRILDNVFNINGTTKYKRGNYSGSYLVNMLYYNSEKLALKSQSYIQSIPRQADVYKLYYKSQELEQHDTVFLTCIVTHLKAGSTSSNATERATAAQQIMAYLNNRGINGNILILGDFNVYKSSEAAFQAFMTPTSTGVRFYDPVNALGDWNNNALFAKYHTQSTSVTTGCKSSGGMDDRFDFILGTQQIIQGTSGAKYVDNSYWAYGQDGLRLNSTISNPANSSLPSNVISALSLMSDHLPVTLKLYINATPLSSAIQTQLHNKISFVNPVETDLVIWSQSDKEETISLSIFNQIGALVMKKNITIMPGEKQTINANALSSGIYWIQTIGKGFQQTSKIIKQ